MVVVSCGHDGVSFDASSVGQHHTRRPVAVIEDGRDFRRGLEHDPLALCHADHRLYDFIHSAHGVPRAKASVGVVHEGVEGGGVFGFGTQEQHRKFHDLEQLGVREVLTGERTERRKQRQACGVNHRLPFRELEGVVRRLVHEFVHADVVLHLRLGHEVLELLACAGFNLFKDRGQGVEPRGDFERAILKPHRVGGVESNEVHFLVHVGSKILEVTFKHVRHPVPARAHVKREPFRFKFPSPAAQCVVSFQNAYAMPGFGQIACRGKAGKAGSEDQNLVGG